jgi:hypothetical protein
MISEKSQRPLQLSHIELIAFGLRQLRKAKLLEAEGVREIIDAALMLITSEGNDRPFLSCDIGSPGGNQSYLSMKQLLERIPYSEKTIRNLMSKGILVEGQHYFKRRSGGRVMFSWTAMREWVEGRESAVGDGVPLVRNRRHGRSS